MAKRKFTQDEVYELGQAYNADYLDVPAYKQRTFREIIEKEARGEEDKKATGKNYKEEMDREIAAKRSPLFREEQEFYKKQEQPKKKAENPKPSVVAPTTSTNMQKESDMEEYDSLAEEDIYDDTTIVEPSAKANPATGKNYKEEIDREIAAKRSPLFREEQEFYKKQEQPKKEKEKPQPTADTPTTSTNMQKNQISSIDDIIAYHMDTPSYRAAEAYLESLRLKSQSEQRANAPFGKEQQEGFAGPTNSYERWRKRAEDSESAYISLIKESIARKNDLAKKQERNARSQAIANALGSLVNVFTANALARKGGYIPIIAQYNKEPDSLLRKSIEGRYAIENESEALLSKLANERRKHEQEFAMQGYKQDVAEANALYKMDYDERKRKQEWSDWEAKEEKRHKNRMAEIEARGENALGVAGVKADNAVKVAEIKGAQKQQAEAEAGAKKTYKVKDKNAQNQFVKATTVSEEKKTNAIGEEVKETKENKNLVPYMNKAYAYFEKNGMSGDEMTKAASVLKEIARTHSGALMSNISDSINEMVKNLIKDKRNFSADQIVQSITNAIEKSKTN